MITSAHFRTYCHATEDEDKVREAFKNISRVPNRDVELTINKGYHGNEIRILESHIKKKGAALNSFLAALAEHGIFDKLKDQIEQRLDDEGMFYLRFDKQEAYKHKFVLDSGEDTIQVRVKVQAYPAKPEKILEELRAHIEKLEKASSKKKAKKTE